MMPWVVDTLLGIYIGEDSYGDVENDIGMGSVVSIILENFRQPIS